MLGVASFSNNNYDDAHRDFCMATSGETGVVVAFTKLKEVPFTWEKATPCKTSL